jgi:N-acetylglucosamine-6-sulfatase
VRSIDPTGALPLAGIFELGSGQSAAFSCALESRFCFVETWRMLKQPLRALAIVCTLCSFNATAGENSTIRRPQPNVLFILCDDLRWDALGYAGNPYVKTPNIDRLAREGTQFRNTFCTTSLCSPSRASILGGLYAHVHGVVNNFTEYPTNIINFPTALQSAGYDTAYVGKWHMGEDNDQPRAGFNFFASHKGQGKYFDTEWNINGTGSKKIPGYYTHVVTDMALDWLKRDHKNKPWLLMIGHKAPHSFYVPEPKYSNVFENVWIPYPESAFHLDDKPAWIKDRLYTWHGIYGPLFEWRKQFPDDRPEAVKDFANMIRAYWSTILSVDDSVGNLLAELNHRGELDRTIIVFMGDNGLLNGENGMVDKRTMHEPSIRIPMVIRYPPLNGKAFAQGKVIEEQVLTVDIAPDHFRTLRTTAPEKHPWQIFRETGSRRRQCLA